MASTAPSSKLHPFGTQLHVSTDSGANYTQYFDMMLVSPPDLKRDTAEVTVLDSPNFAKEFIASWIDDGEIPFEFFYAAAGTILSTFLTLFKAGAILYFKIVLPLASGGNTKANFIFQGIITELKLTEAKAGENNAFSCPAKIKIATDTGFAFNVGT